MGECGVGLVCPAGLKQRTQRANPEQEGLSMSPKFVAPFLCVGEVFPDYYIFPHGVCLIQLPENV